MNCFWNQLILDGCWRTDWVVVGCGGEEAVSPKRLKGKVQRKWKALGKSEITNRKHKRTGVVVEENLEVD